MKIYIVKQDKLIDGAIRTSELFMKKELIEEALKPLIQVKKQSRLKKLKGKLKWEGSSN